MLNFTWPELLRMLAETIWESRPGIFKKEFWVSDFPDYYHPKCFKCNFDQASCIDCGYRAWGQSPNAKCVDGEWTPS